MSPIQIDQAELLKRARAHPVSGPILDVITRDLALEQLGAENTQLRARLAELEPTDESPATD